MVDLRILRNRGKIFDGDPTSLNWRVRLKTLHFAYCFFNTDLYIKISAKTFDKYIVFLAS